MFCPNCGANNSTEQRFCRSCGLNLEQTAESLLMQIPAGKSPRLQKPDSALEKFGKFAFIGFVAIVLAFIAGLIFALVQYAIKHEGAERLIGIGMILFIVFAALMLVYVYLAQAMKDRKVRDLDDNEEYLENKETAPLLEDKPFTPISSIVEDTTDRLHVKQKTKKFE